LHQRVYRREIVLFNSFFFLFIFLPIVLVIYFSLIHIRFFRYALGFLLIASLTFYSLWDIRYLPLLLFSIGFNFLMGRRIEQHRTKINLAIGIIVNLTLLGYFKYLNFFLDNVAALIPANIVTQIQSSAFPSVILPLGISFYTFTQLAYIIDAYRGETKKYSLLDYSLFVTYFPHLIAGPILSHNKVIPQMEDVKGLLFSSKNFSIGICLFSIGLFKKVMVADTLSPWVAPVFANAGPVSFFDGWIGALAYTLQLYFDFSGYCDMAVGMAYMIGIIIPFNFDSPYKSSSIIDFWRTWNMTLSAFLRNYLYIPLGGNRKGFPRQVLNVMITMFLGGLWHGAGWTFVVWGTLHGAYISIDHGWRNLKIPLPKILCQAITLVAVVVAWVFFRASSVSDALEILKGMAGLKGFALPTAVAGTVPALKSLGFSMGSKVIIPGGALEVLLIGVLMIIVWLLPNSQEIALKYFKPRPIWFVVVVGLFLISLMNMAQVSEFLYYQF
jgi:alginate O-acetyltransferase complex protein AlgI